MHIFVEFYSLWQLVITRKIIRKWLFVAPVVRNSHAFERQIWLIYNYSNISCHIVMFNSVDGVMNGHYGRSSSSVGIVSSEHGCTTHHTTCPTCFRLKFATEIRGIILSSEILSSSGRQKPPGALRRHRLNERFDKRWVTGAPILVF